MSALMFLIWLVAEISVSTAERNQPKTVPGFTYIGSITDQTIRAAFQSKLFYLSQDVTNETTARSNCKNIFDGSLVTIPNANKDNDIREMLEKQDPNNAVGGHGGVWTAGKRDYAQTQWYWSTTLVSIQYTNWLSPHPIRYYDSDCISIHGRGRRYGWQSSVCKEIMRYICEV